MAIVIALVLGILALVFVLYPLFQRTAAPQVAVSSEPEPVVEQDEAARAALREVELDYQLGNIVEPDYRTLRERYMRRALTAFKTRYEREKELDALIEEQLEQMKKIEAKSKKEVADDE
ncbi:hypothetical protein EI42_04856 [Thermosporothrix hazakensis]|jgi:hypothetical protein|uniref:C-type cytochrome biogenesis protein CcmI n=2 Tax=Thermosporothrix TaxID=768650 RepID=A0A326U1W6_THEHA|nr:hypothetical protein [Thermosporothrix hazakensis]PZW23931.1 hypothetical protein EI42_04856 [Thermosporothrix hazakensis]BBH90433.1 hypothetical protein KTC_51840 [Thermosporothrix sp. COM3]GCE48470.1 hypothetical protein KTH_33390 [Thermosporothrix hazakensis]